MIVPANCVNTYDLPVDAAQKIGALPHDGDFADVYFFVHDGTEQNRGGERNQLGGRERRSKGELLQWETTYTEGLMGRRKFSLVARVSTENPKADKRVLKELVSKSSITRSAEGFVIKGRAERRKRPRVKSGPPLRFASDRAEDEVARRVDIRGTTERFFDYVPKGTHQA